MSKKEKKRCLILLTFYVIGLLGNTLLQLGVPYFTHRQQLLTMAEETAVNYTNGEDLGDVNQFELSWLIYDFQGNCIDSKLYGYPDDVYHVDPTACLSAAAENRTFFGYRRIGVYNPLSDNEPERFLFLVASVPFNDGEEATGVLILLHRMEDLPGHLTAFWILWSILFGLLFLSILWMNKKERELEQLQRNYIAAMNHELKSPITSIKALSETLLEGYVTDPQKQLFYYNTILNEAKNLEGTVNEILELSKLQSTKSLYKKDQVSAAEVFTPVLARYTQLCEDIEIRFEAPDLSGLALPVLFTSGELIARVLDLLLHNALKFTEGENGRIQVSVLPGTEQITVCVADNGCGISTDALPHIFDRFYQAETAHSKNGSGLGLSIVREILEGLNENIWVKSEAGKGSAFTFTIHTKD